MSVFGDFVVNAGLKIEDKYKVKPENHDTAKYLSSDGTIRRYNEIDDMHLINIFMMMKKSYSMSLDLLKVEEESIENIFMIEMNLWHTSYEIWQRGLFVANNPLYEIIKEDGRDS